MTGGVTIAFRRPPAAFSARRCETRRGLGPGLGGRLRRCLISLRPSATPQYLLEAGGRGRGFAHAMHSISDALTFAVWENGQWMPSLTGSLVASPRAGREEARCDVGRSDYDPQR